MNRLLILIFVAVIVVPTLVYAFPLRISGCEAERAAFCLGVEPGRGQVYRCLKANYLELSDQCQAGLVRSSVFTGWVAISTITPGRIFQVYISWLLLGFVFFFLQRIRPIKADQPIRRKGFIDDLLYGSTSTFVIAPVTAYVVIECVGILAEALGPPRIQSLLDGFGPVRTLPVFLQGVLVFVINDFIGYWVHRLLHVRALWRFHAPHHSSEELDWLSGFRNHPVADVFQRVLQILPFIFLGLPISTVAWMLPAVMVIDAFAHSNVRWDFGPLRKWVVSPVFHRRHHFRDVNHQKACNFGGHFAIWDVLFGTASFAKNVDSPCGVSRAYPQGFFRQLAAPFRRWH